MSGYKLGAMVVATVVQCAWSSMYVNITSPQAHARYAPHARLQTCWRLCRTLSSDGMEQVTVTLHVDEREVWAEQANRLDVWEAGEEVSHQSCAPLTFTLNEPMEVGQHSAMVCILRRDAPHTLAGCQEVKFQVGGEDPRLPAPPLVPSILEESGRLAELLREHGGDMQEGIEVLQERYVGEGCSKGILQRQRHSSSISIKFMSRDEVLNNLSGLVREDQLEEEEEEEEGGGQEQSKKMTKTKKKTKFVVLSTGTEDLEIFLSLASYDVFPIIVSYVNRSFPSLREASSVWEEEGRRFGLELASVDEEFRRLFFVKKAPPHRDSCDDKLKFVQRSSVPVVILHWGMEDCDHCVANPEYLKAAIRTAREHGNTVLLVGDENNHHLQDLPQVIWFDKEQFQESANKLDAVYQHLSSNARDYELGCMKRVMMLHDLMSDLAIPSLFHIDSDVLLFVKVEEFLSRWREEEVWGAWLRPQQRFQDFDWVESIASAFLTSHLIKELKDFILDLYTTSQGLSLLQTKVTEYVVKRGGVGGVCDMTAYYLFSHCTATRLDGSQDFPLVEEVCPKPRAIGSIANLMVVEGRRGDGGGGGYSFDLNINEGNGFKMKCEDEGARRGCVKEVTIEDDAVWGWHEAKGRIRFLSLHFQGSAKFWMPQVAESIREKLRRQGEDRKRE